MKNSTLPAGLKKIAGIVAAAVILSGLGYGTYYSYGLYRKLQATEQELSARTVAFETRIKDLEQKIEVVEEENNDITATLNDEQKKNLDLERQRRRNEREIDTLTKLTTIDPELLKKYSKVYFLSENYVPPGLADIDSEYLIDPSRQLQVLDKIEPFLEKMLEEAEEDGVELRVLSAYRSFTEQKSLKSAYVVQYGSGANRFSAEQGYSEHQLGTAVDFTTPTIRGAYTSFENAPAFAWLAKNAHNYGFVLSYPKGNAYYIYEPWHWRFVGEELADHLYFERQNFYQMDQREIDEYLITIFD